MPRGPGNSLNIKGDVTNKNSGVKASMGMVMERSELSIALKYRTQANTRIAVENANAGMKDGPGGGAPCMARKTYSNGSEKNMAPQDMIYPSTLWETFFPKTSIKDVKKAVSKARISHMVQPLFSPGSYVRLKF